ncbi:MAG: flagellar motor switch protein FliM [Planctomycetes bacterium]|nr:flagellar motor switch protein FliM [Planctomycetota bacterium]
MDALLAAVDGGEIDFEAKAGAGPAAAATDRAVAGDLSLYDFKRPERVSKDQMRSLETLHEVFARGFAASLSGYLRTIVEVKLVSVEQLTYSEFINSLPNPTCFNLLDASPLDGSMILEFNPSIVYPVLDRLLGGGTAEPTVPDRAMTEIELRLISTILGRALDQLRDAWANVLDINFKLLETESNPLLMQIVAPNEPVVLICFEVTMGESTGLINLCIPFKIIEPIMKKITTQQWFAGAEKVSSEANRRAITAKVSRAVLGVTAFLAEATITLRDLRNLQVGDVIRTDKGQGDDAILVVEGRPLFRCRPGKLKGNVAVRVTRVSEPGEPA